MIGFTSVHSHPHFAQPFAICYIFHQTIVVSIDTPVSFSFFFHLHFPIPTHSTGGEIAVVITNKLREYPGTVYRVAANTSVPCGVVICAVFAAAGIFSLCLVFCVVPAWAGCGRHVHSTRSCDLFKNGFESFRFTIIDGGNRGLCIQIFSACLCSFVFMLGFWE